MFPQIELRLQHFKQAREQWAPTARQQLVQVK
jgi:hypothetical protein